MSGDFGAFVPGPRARLAPLGSGSLDGLTFVAKDLLDVAGHPDPNEGPGLARVAGGKKITGGQFLPGNEGGVGGGGLGCAAFDRLYVWDFARGTLYREVPYYGAAPQGQALFTSDDHVLLGKTVLIDLENQVKLWTYQGAELVKGLGELCWFLPNTGPQQAGALVPSPVPQPGVKETLARAEHTAAATRSAQARFNSRGAEHPEAGDDQGDAAQAAALDAIRS